MSKFLSREILCHAEAAEDNERGKEDETSELLFGLHGYHSANWRSLVA